MLPSAAARPLLALSTSTGLKGRLEARPYNRRIAFVGAGFQRALQRCHRALGAAA